MYLSNLPCPIHTKYRNYFYEKVNSYIFKRNPYLLELFGFLQFQSAKVMFEA